MKIQPPQVALGSEEDAADPAVDSGTRTTTENTTTLLQDRREII